MSNTSRLIICPCNRVVNVKAGELKTCECGISLELDFYLVLGEKDVKPISWIPEDYPIPFNEIPAPQIILEA